MIIEFDSDGYPISRSLKALNSQLEDAARARNFSRLRQVAHQELSGAISSAGGRACGGFVDKEIAGEILRVFYFSTGGWKGNEQIVDTILSAGNRIIRLTCLVAWEAGGHYYFNWGRGGD